MIHVKKDFDNPPAYISYTNKRHLKRLTTACTEQNKHNFTRYSHKSVKKALKDLYHKKCAYCEAKVPHAFNYHIEHYRPKKEVTEDSTHDGYYWLGYEWSNLLWACGRCNGNKGEGKGNQFPISGIRATAQPILDDGTFNFTEFRANSSVLLAEQSILIHPEIDEPKNFFIFKPDGEIKGIDDAGRGKKTIEICDLNREDLVIARKKIIDDFLVDLKVQVVAYEKTEISLHEFARCIKNILAKIYQRTLPENEFSRLYFFMFNKFHLFFAVQFSAPIKIALNKIHLRFLKELNNS